MKLAEVEVGGIYSVKVSGRLTLVRVVAVRRGGESGFGRRQPSFVGVNVRTGREVRGGLARLRARAHQQPGGGYKVEAVVAKAVKPSLAVVDRLGPLHTEALRQVVKYAAGRAITCPCGKVLDAASTVLGERGDHTVVRCAECGVPPGYTLTHDGRELFTREAELSALRTRDERRLNGGGMFRRSP